ncbi:MAG: RING finger protein [Planctomycetota bacterium]
MNFAEVIIVAAIIYALARAIIPRLGGWNKAFDMVAKRYNATVFRGYLFTRPSMVFTYGSTGCRVRTRRSSRFKERRQTDVEMQWPDPNFRLIVSSAPDQVNARAESRGWFRSRTEPVEIEGTPFDSSLSIKSNDPDVAKKFFTSNVQWEIEQLRRHLGNEQLLIEISGGRFLVAKPGFIKHHVLLDDFIRYSLELYDRMSLCNVEGIEFVNEDRAKVVDDCVCPICADKIEYEMVICVRCKTPHCLDCWQYNGQCATFACKETRYLRAGDSAARA